MVRQAQNYFAAAVSAAVLNAAAIAGFVLLMLLSGGHVLPLAGLLNASNPFQSAADSEAAPAPDLSSGGLAGLKQRSSQFAASDGRNGAGAGATH
jgi:hypothetical protein